MNYTKGIIIRKTNEIGTRFAQSFPAREGVAIGSRFIGANDREYIVGRIDNVVVGYKTLHVEGYCIPANLE